MEMAAAGNGRMANISWERGEGELAVQERVIEGRREKREEKEEEEEETAREGKKAVPRTSEEGRLLSLSLSPGARKGRRPPAGFRPPQINTPSTGAAAAVAAAVPLAVRVCVCVCVCASAADPSLSSRPR
jgi:hypothetical protein